MAFLQSIKPVHSNIVHYFAVTEHYFIAEYHPLGSLEHYLTPDTEPPVFDWTLQICDATAYLHGLGFAHTQLHPYNILVAKGVSELVICDFGTACPKHEMGAAPDGYAPPELPITQHQTSVDVKERRGDATDVYCIGLLIWFMQNGRKPIPDNYLWLEYEEYPELFYIEAISSHLDILDVTDLQLADLMRACWSPLASRPSITHLLDRLHAMQ